LQAQQSPMPELRLVVLALQDKLAYGTTFEAALRSLFGGETSSLAAGDTAQATPTGHGAAQAGGVAQAAGAPQPAEDRNGLIAEASKDFDEYQRLTAAGKLGEAGQKLDALKAALAKLSARQK
jgi:uncharacterized membrane protein (UPF0182 family)